MSDIQSDAVQITRAVVSAGDEEIHKSLIHRWSEHEFEAFREIEYLEYRQDHYNVNVRKFLKEEIEVMLSIRVADPFMSDTLHTRDVANSLPYEYPNTELGRIIAGMSALELENPKDSSRGKRYKIVSDKLNV